jgi:molecular chaperone HscB
MQNHFALFHLPEQFAVDMTALDRAYHEVQNQVHPDKFVAGTAAEKRVAMQWATRANEAYQTLREPLRRATYLCELHGVALQAESNTAMPMAFLMQQMAWREALDEARAGRDVAALDGLDSELRQAWRDLLGEAAALFDQADFASAAQVVRKLMFLEKFREEIARVVELLES